MAKTTQKATEIPVVTLEHEDAVVWIVGTAPFYANRMTAKAKRSLLLPPQKMNRATRATRLKHAPLYEYRDSPHQRRSGETMLLMRSDAIKKAIATAALDMPTAVAKAEINRLVTAIGEAGYEYVPLFGRPELAMDIVKLAGISRVPDVRTRARLERWAMRVRLQWVRPLLSSTSVFRLLQAGGMTCGLGDWRREKGGIFGTFRIAQPDDKELADIIAGGSYAEQELAMRVPHAVNDETAETMEWYYAELLSRDINPEDQQPEDVEFVEGDPYFVGANDERVPVPNGLADALPVQEGEAS